MRPMGGPVVKMARAYCPGWVWVDFAVLRSSLDCNSTAATINATAMATAAATEAAGEELVDDQGRCDYPLRRPEKPASKMAPAGPRRPL